MPEVTTKRVGISEYGKAAVGEVLGRIAGKLAVAAAAHCKHPAVTWVVELTPESVKLGFVGLRMHATAIDDHRFGVAVRRTLLEEQGFPGITDSAVRAAYQELMKAYDAYVAQL